MRARRLPVLVLFGLSVLAVPATAARGTDLAEVVPGDSWIVLAVRPQDGEAEQSEDTSPRTDFLATAAMIVDQARRMGVGSDLDLKTGLLVDGLASLPLLTCYPYVVCVLDAAARPLGQRSYRLSELRLLVVIQTGGANERVEQRIRQLLNAHVNTGTGRLETVERAGGATYRLHDSRLPEWAVLEWGPAGEHYLLALGSGSFDAVLSVMSGMSASLADDPWFRNGNSRCRGSQARLWLTVRFDAIRGGLKDVMAGEPERVLAALRLGETERGLWTLGALGRVVRSYGLLHRQGEDSFLEICDPRPDPGIVKVIPEDATRFAVIDQEPAKLVRWVRDAYLASRSPSARDSLREMWAEIETEMGVNADQDVLAQLGRPAVIHDYPRHPLGMPLARTILVPVRGSAPILRRGLDRLLERAKRHLDRPDAGWAALRLHHAEDGIWYLQAGLNGPALAVTDRWLVISYSPAAVRQNLALLQSSAGGAASRPAPAGTRS